ncbi:MAG: Gfo/Idh/MocA family oxidoreductase [Longimicrobiales bacterium]
MSDQYDRRGFLKTAAAAGMGLTLGANGACASATRPGSVLAAPAATTPFAAPPLDTVRTGFIGVGNRGPTHVRNLLRLEGVEVRAICDLVPGKVARAQQMVTEAGQPQPTGYSRGPEHYRRMCEQEDLDLVVISTPWEWHAPMAVAAMENGKHAAVEIPMGITIEECWQMVETSERTGRHCVILENCCYDRTELMILNMVRQNLLGELLHAECGYLHDLRELKLTDYYEGRWRVKHSITTNGDLYPNHGLGPVAWWLNINRGNQFDHLVSMSTKSRGLQLWAAEHIGPDSAEARQHYAHGDVVNTLIRTTHGETILITHDTDTPRPYSRKILLQGTNGLVRKYPEQKIHIEGRSPEHRWEELDTYQAAYEHPLWTALEERARGGGHGGMDYIMAFRLIQSLREGTPTDLDVYDGAAWSAVVDLSGQSIAARSRSVDVPDFTRGAWRNRPPLEINEPQPRRPA